MITIEEKMADTSYMATLPNNRLVALAQGVPHYYSKPCKNGHDSYRKTANGQCCKCASLDTAARLKQMPKEQLKQVRVNIDKKWNNSTKGQTAKQRWKERDPKWAWIVSAVGGARARSKEQDVPFSITNEYILSITSDTCPVLGTKFIFIGGSSISKHSPSIDKIIPALGYVEGNVAVISARANMIKSNASYEEVQQVADWLKTVTTL